ncbi:MAG: penicillin-binding transpeptidase domain-containing protein [Gammaproteobacteria bacterium]|nr:penicillin-binding transpeptidase domain-containing protein [Gammaproteobacteria bacterium]
MVTKRRYHSLFVSALVVYLLIVPIEPGANRATPAEAPVLNRHDVARLLSDHVSRNEFPERIMVPLPHGEVETQVTYTLEPHLQDVIERVYQRYKPDYAAFVALDAETGRILSLASYEKDAGGLGNLALRASYPAASIFKIVTAAAALEEGVADPSTVVPYNGKSTSLYKRQVFRHRNNKWTRRITLSDAFAKSVNTVFARLGVFDIGAQTLHEYAGRFGFNQSIESDLLFKESVAPIAAEDEWTLAEAASGFTRSNTLSPLHGAMIAAVVVNDGKMFNPYIVEQLADENQVVDYRAIPEVIGASIRPETAAKLRKLMVSTVQKGSARRSFRKFFRNDLRDVEVGGKTGSLTGTSPKGRNDWFIGYAAHNGRKVAFASLTVNREKWTVKSAYVARKIIEAYYEQ